MKFLIFLSALLFFVSLSSCKNKDNVGAEEKPEVVEPKWEDYKGDYTKKAEFFVQDAGVALKTRLTEAIAKGGFEKAINVCNEVAQKMMDSISTTNKVQIKRTSIKFRNTKNAPDQKDLAMLSAYDKLQKEGKPLASDGIELENRMVKLYVPIMTDKLCLNCHGVIGQDIKPKVYDLIKKLYPNDEAVGYKEGELRGVWVVQMEK
jgi:hypothetical protein